VPILGFWSRFFARFRVNRKSLNRKLQLAAVFFVLFFLVVLPFLSAELT